MDPNLFAIDNERLFEVLVAIIVLSFFLERFLALIFENRWVVNRLSNRGLKEPITFILAVLVCRYWDFDAVSVVFAKAKTQLWGHILTGGIVAGGSKASIKFFQDVMGTMSNAEKTRRDVRKAERDAEVLAAAKARG